MGARIAPLAALLAVLAVGVQAAAQSGPVPRFVGAVNPDGCGFCCEFSCQLTPTPTPEFDPQGRRIFRRGTGRFLFVAEAGVGTSGRPPGSEGVYSVGTFQPIVNPSGRPSLQIIPSRSLGNGSPQIDCHGEHLGGVPGFPNGLAFPPGQNITTALTDMACRFQLSSSSATSCTRNRYGGFAFMHPSTTRQFCYPMPAAASFPFGDTIVALQFLDTNGNIGPRQEIVIRVDESGPVSTPTRTGTPTRTPTPTATPASAGISGRIRYYSNNRPVPDALVQLSGATTQSRITTSTGTHAFTSLSAGMATLEPRKLGGTGNPTAISAVDASRILQWIAGLHSLDANQRLACDVTGDGTLSALDAARILQWQVGLLSRFAVCDRCGSDWVFRPSPESAPNQRLVEPLLTTGSCRRGAIALEPLTGTVVQQDFIGMVFGDCTGNWEPPSGAGPAFAATAPGPHTLRVRRARPASGGWRLPMAVKGGDPYYTLNLTLTYDDSTLTPVGLRRLRALGDAQAVFHAAEPGVVRIAVASGVPMAAGVSIIAMDFEGTGTADDVRVESALVDDRPAAIE